MSGSGFVDKNLFGLKDKLRNYQDEKNTKNSDNAPPKKEQSINRSSHDNKKEKIVKLDISENLSKKDNNTEISKAKEHKKEKSNIDSSTVSINKTKDNSKITTVKPKLDKEYIKALAERKEEFIHKQSDLIKRVKLNLNKLPCDIQKYEKYLTESKSLQRRLELILEKISVLNEKDWDKYDYTLELADAVRIIEHSRLELFTLQQNTDCLIEEDIPGLKKDNVGSILPELTSITFGQTLKMGIGFFLPLIIGILLASGIITLGMFIAMGIF